MKSMIDKLNEIIPDLPDRHSFFQIKHFIIGKEPTHQGKLQTCLRELRSRREELKAIEMELADEHDNQRLLLIKLEQHQERDQTEKRQILQRKVKRQLAVKEARIQNLRKRLQAVEQESHFILEVYEWLLTQEPLKDWDDFTVQGEYWGKKLIKELQISLCLSRTVDSEMVQSILALPDDAPVKQELLKIYSTQQQRIES